MRWTKAEDAIVLAWQGSIRALARHLGRSFSATRMHYYRLRGYSQFTPRPRTSPISPTHQTLMQNFFRVVILVDRLRRQGAITGELAGEQWLSVLIARLHFSAAASRRHGFPPPLQDLEDVLRSLED